MGWTNKFRCICEDGRDASLCECHSRLFGFAYHLFSVRPFGIKEIELHIRKNGTKEYFDDSLYPMNLLRDLAIEAIHTSHFLYLDADFFTSSK